MAEIKDKVTTVEELAYIYNELKGQIPTGGNTGPVEKQASSPTDDYIINVKCSDEQRVMDKGGEAGIKLQWQSLAEPGDVWTREVRFADNYIYPGSSVLSLGSRSKMWNTVYASMGLVQSSDRAVKEDIHYIDGKSAEGVRALSDAGMESPSIDGEEAVSPDTVLDFIRALRPATFRYKGADDSDNSPEALQLGVIADDMKDDPLFKYIGCEMKDGESVMLGVKPVPLAVAALTACKYLLERVDELEKALKAKEN